MQQRTIILVVILFVLIVVGMFTFAFLQRGEPAVDPAPVPPRATDTPSRGSPDSTDNREYPSVTRITAKHFIEDGTHTFVGEIPMPTPCDLIETDAVVRESDPEQVELQFSVLNTADTCAQVITPQRFSISATASPEATVSATFNGRPVELNLVPPGPNETPEDFSVYQKG